MVVDLVEKLKSLGLFGADLLHTTNGREYITKERVKQEIETTLDRCGGRVALIDLPGLLNVDLAHCAAQAELLVNVRTWQARVQNCASAPGASQTRLETRLCVCHTTRSYAGKCRQDHTGQWGHTVHRIL